MTTASVDSNKKKEWKRAWLPRKLRVSKGKKGWRWLVRYRPFNAYGSGY